MLEIDAKKVKRIVKKITWFLGKKAFLSFVVFVFFALFLGGTIFYYYAFLTMTREPEVEIKSIQLNERLYETFLENYRERKIKFNEIDWAKFLVEVTELLDSFGASYYIKKDLAIFSDKVKG